MSSQYVTYLQAHLILCSYFIKINSKPLTSQIEFAELTQFRLQNGTSLKFGKNYRRSNFTNCGADTYNGYVTCIYIYIYGWMLNNIALNGQRLKIVHHLLTVVRNVAQENLHIC